MEMVGCCRKSRATGLFRFADVHGFAVISLPVAIQINRANHQQLQRILAHFGKPVVNSTRCGFLPLQVQGVVLQQPLTMHGTDGILAVGEHMASPEHVGTTFLQGQPTIPAPEKLLVKPFICSNGGINRRTLVAFVVLRAPIQGLPGADKILCCQQLAISSFFFTPTAAAGKKHHECQQND